MTQHVFDAVHLDHDVPKLGGHAGQVYANTSYFSAAGGYHVWLDTESGLTHIVHKSGGAIVVPRERVKRFEPAKDVPKPADTEAKRGPGRPRKDAAE